MINLYNILLYKPLLQTLIFLYETAALQDLGVAIIFLTIIIRAILYPLFYKSFLNQTLMQRLQPLITKIQHEHKHDREKQAQALMALYKEHKVNPFLGIFLILIQLPILIALYQVFLHPPAELSGMFLNLIDLAKPNIIIVGLAALAQYFQGKLTLPKGESEKTPSQTAKIAKQMVYFGPAISVVILWQLPAAVGLYWLVTSLVSLGQQLYVNYKINKDYGKLTANNSKTSGINTV